MDGLIEWCEDLDYDKYMENWTVIATSAKIEMSSTGGLVGAETSFQKTTNQSSFHQQQSEGVGYDPIRQQRIQQDLLTKQNLEYETRLKEHLYFFQDEQQSVKK